jgi:2',3'-cyclic-nucleotide 2'-phosphodiesterase/3'-nucleotidase
MTGPVRRSRFTCIAVLVALATLVWLPAPARDATLRLRLLSTTEFVVATNNYRASGGGNFPGMDGSNIVLEGAETNQELIKDWLIKQRTVDVAVTPIWSFVPIAAPVQVVFESSPEARTLVGDGMRIRHIGEGQNGFGLYSLGMR